MEVEKGDNKGKYVKRVQFGSLQGKVKGNKQLDRSFGSSAIRRLDQMSIKGVIEVKKKI